MMKTAWGWILAALAIVMLLLAFAEVYAPVERTSFGFVVAPSSIPEARGVVTGLVAGSDGYQQGIRNGDLVDVMAMPLSDRLRLELQHSPPGTTLTIPIIHDGTRRSFSVRAYAAGAISPLTSSWPFLLSVIVTLLIVAVIALRKPSIATASLVLYGMGSVLSGDIASLFSWLPDGWFAVIGVFILTALSMLPAAALMPFVVRFPEIPVTGTGRLRVRVADAIFLLAAITCLIQILNEPVIFSSWTLFDILGPFVLLLLALLFASFAYRDIAGEARRRVSWVIAGVVVSAMAYAAFNILVPLFSGAADSATLAVLAGGSQILSCALPLALAYAVLRHRVLDIGFALNRTLVYGTMTTFAVVVVSLVDWVSGRMLSEQRYTLAIEAIVAIGFGFILNWLHSKTERLIDRVVFRERHICEKRIEYRIGALGFASSTTAIDEALGVEAAHILSLASAAVFTRLGTDEPYTCRASTGWEHASLRALDVDSLIVCTLLSLERPLILDDVAICVDGAPLGDERPMIAIPMVSHHDLLGFVLYGNHREGAFPDPEEIALLAKLCAAAERAYGDVEARQWRDRATILMAAQSTS